MAQGDGEGRTIRLNPAAVRARLGAMAALAEQLERSAHAVTSAADAAAAGDPEGWLSAGTARAQTAAERVQAQVAALRALLGDAATTVEAVAQTAAAPLALDLPRAAADTLEHQPARAQVYAVVEEGTPAAAPRLGSDQDQLAWLAYRLGEQGRSPSEIDAAVAALRLQQIERALAALRALNPDQRWLDAEASAARSQAELDHFISVIDSIASGLDPMDRDFAGYLARLSRLSAQQERVDALQLQLRIAQLELEQAELLLQQAQRGGAAPGELAALTAQRDAAAYRLAGDPAAANEIAVLERQRQDLAAQQTLLQLAGFTPLGGLARLSEQQIAAAIAAIDARLAYLRPQVAGLTARLAQAEAERDEASGLLAAAEQQLQTTIAEYQAAIQAGLPQQQALIDEKIAEFQAAGLDPELVGALTDLRDVLGTTDPEELQRAITYLETTLDRHNPDVTPFFQVFLSNFVFPGDRRIAITSGREIFAEWQAQSGLERFVEDVALNTLLLGLPSYLENRRILDTPGASAAVYDGANLGLALDYAGFVLLLAGPAIGGVSRVMRGGRQVLNLSDEGRAALRAAGYTDEALAALDLRLSTAASTDDLARQLLRSSSEELDDLFQRMRALETGATRGLDPTAETIRQGTVRMELHPHYVDTLNELRALGYDIRFTTGDPYVAIVEVVDRSGTVLRVDRTVYLQEGMRYIDLEHELGHVYQIRDRFGGSPPPTERLVQLPNGNLKNANNLSGVLTTRQNAALEYHNRLEEFLRLHERGVDPELLREHADGIRHWRAQYHQIFSSERSPSRLREYREWVHNHLGDVSELQRRYEDLGGRSYETP